MVVQRVGNDVRDRLCVCGRPGTAAVDFVRQLGQLVRDAVRDVRTGAGTRIGTDHDPTVKLHRHDCSLEEK